MKKKIFIVLGILSSLLLTTTIIIKIWVNNNMNKPQIPVLMYHNVVYDEDYKGQVDTISISMFEKQLKYFKENNIKTLTLDEFYCWKKNKCNISNNSVLLTFDDGFYSFHYLVEPLLEKYEMYAVNFVIGSTVKEKTPKYNAQKYGTIGKDNIDKPSMYVDYQSHSYSMHQILGEKPKIYKMTLEELKQDLQEMKKIKDFKYISYPFNTDTDEFIQILKSNGYLLAFRGESEKATKSCNDYQISRIGISEDFDEFKKIFETNKKNNRYGNGLFRKLFVTVERKLNLKLF